MANKNEKRLQVCIFEYLIKKGNGETVRDFIKETGLTHEDLDLLRCKPNFFEDWWQCFTDTYLSRRTFLMQNSVPELKQQHALTIPDSDMAFVSSVINSDPLLSYPSSAGYQILPTPQEDLANNHKKEVGLERPNPLNLGTRNPTSMQNSVAEPEKQHALIMPNPDMAFDDIYNELDPLPLWSNSSARNQILPTPQEYIANNHNKEVGLERPNPLNLGTPEFLCRDTYVSQQSPSHSFMQNSVAERALAMTNPDIAFADSLINWDPKLSNPSGAQNQIPQTPQARADLANYHNIDVRLKRVKRRKLMNLGTPGMLSSYSDGARSNSMSMNSSASAAGMSEPRYGINESESDNRSALLEFKKWNYSLTCCDFSSDGDILACISKYKAAWLWNMKKSKFEFTPIRQPNPKVMSVRFASSSSHFAACNLNSTVELWDAKDLKEPLCMFSIKEPLTSMDFNPRNINQLCCADKNEVRLWNVFEQTSEVLFKGYTREIRFQPGDGNMLAVISKFNGIKLFDVETKSTLLTLKGHGNTSPLAVCWDISGNNVASVSEDKALIWSINSGNKPIYEIKSTAKTFRSFTPHPKYPQAFVIGSNQSLEVWNPSVSNTTQSVNAHNGCVNNLCSSSQAGLIASTSTDDCLKLWK